MNCFPAVVTGYLYSTISSSAGKRPKRAIFLDPTPPPSLWALTGTFSGQFILSQLAVIKMPQLRPRFILVFFHQLSQQNKDMASLLKPSPPSDHEETSGEGALEYYAKHTAQIEVKAQESLIPNVLNINTSHLIVSKPLANTSPCVWKTALGLIYPRYIASVLQIVRRDRTMEQIVFPVPSICEFLIAESKINVYQTCERDDQNSKVNYLLLLLFCLSVCLLGVCKCGLLFPSLSVGSIAT